LVMDQVRAELKRGAKSTHWMWFIFPQLKGLGRSATAETFAISGIEEAEAYLRHEILGPRLRECTQLVNEARGKSIEQIFGYPDDLKFHSSMTLFSNVSRIDNQVFTQALHKYFSGETDAKTIELLRSATAWPKA